MRNVPWRIQARSGRYITAIRNIAFLPFLPLLPLSPLTKEYNDRKKKRERKRERKRKTTIVRVLTCITRIYMSTKDTYIQVRRYSHTLDHVSSIEMFEESSERFELYYTGDRFTLSRVHIAFQAWKRTPSSLRAEQSCTFYGNAVNNLRRTRSNRACPRNRTDQLRFDSLALTSAFVLLLFFSFVLHVVGKNALGESLDLFARMLAFGFRQLVNRRNFWSMSITISRDPWRGRLYFSNMYCLDDVFFWFHPRFSLLFLFRSQLNYVSTSVYFENLK